MKKAKPTLDDFSGSGLSLHHLKHVRGGDPTVPPQGDPGDTNDPSAPKYPPPPPRGGYIDPTPDNPLNP